jgi:multisubunit Na+/H+ antiporter MnhB subunit
MKDTVVRDKRVTLLLITGMLLMSLALFLNTHIQLPDFIKGLAYGIGLGLLVLFCMAHKKEKQKLNRKQNA